MGKFSIRRHKRELSDSATIITVEPSMSPSQRSLYGSITSNRPRNRLQKSPHSPPSPQDENHDTPNDTKRPQRRLLKRFRLPHHHRTGSLEEKTSVTPPKQKPHSNSMPTSPGRSIGLSGRRYASRNWSDNDIPPPRTRFAFTSRRGSVGSSADILLTPIRGSTAISDEDFVFLTRHDYDETIHSQGEGVESPGPMIQTLFTGADPEIHPHPVLLEPIVIEPTYVPHDEPLPSEYKPSPPKIEITLPTPEPEPNHEPEEPPTPMSSSSASETRTITNIIVEVGPKPSTGTSVMSSPAEAEEEPQATNVAEPAPPSSEPNISFPEPALYSPSAKSAGPISPPLVIDTELSSQQNIIPFPDLESARTPTLHRMPSSMVIAEPTKPQHAERATWVVSVYQTAEGIMLLALDCYRWLLRKGFRDDFRSCMSYWFLKELVVGFILPLCLTPVALWLLFRTMHEHGLESALF
ncbi:hypothetical protein RSOLAG22IIIB_03440 [Rhizoctonia solani]|uniref:Uncharacterized protein n=1 Tax=Rhizoctonia solani TaxID=456999 RepID=A0A0K6FPN9_9AGAM|nr:hypothetical protein RSOLAG22IIIB_03440 [Rhizoctonia solani]